MDALRSPLGGMILWIVLHTLDHFLTVKGEIERRKRAAEVIHFSGSYELNPLFQKTVDEQRWVTRRFMVSLIALGLVIPAVFWLDQHGPIPGGGTDVILGVLVFTRLALIARHLQNIWLFRRMATLPSSVTGEITYERKTMVLVSAWQFLGYTAFVVVAAAWTASVFLWGGAAGMAFMTLANVMLAVRKQPAPVEAVAKGQ